MEKFIFYDTCSLLSGLKTIFDNKKRNLSNRSRPSKALAVTPKVDYLLYLLPC